MSAHDKELDVPLIENCPITPAIQQALLAEIDKLVPAKADHSRDENQISQVLVLFRDGYLLPMSALTTDPVTKQQVPIAKEYTLPESMGAVLSSKSITIVSNRRANTDMLAASVWQIIAGRHRCTGG